MAFGITSFAIRNITRRPLRSGALSLGAAALAGALFILGTMYLSVTSSVERGADRLGADAVAVAVGWNVPAGGIILSGGPSGVYLDPDISDRIRAYPDVARSTEQLFIVSAPLACCSLADTVLVGYDPVTDFTVSPWLRDSLGRQLEPDEIVVGPNILSEPGGRIKFFGSVFRVAAKLEPTGINNIDSAVFIPMAAARKMVHESPEVPLELEDGQVSAVLLRFRKGVNHAEAALRMELELPGVLVLLASEAVLAAREDLMGPLRGMAVMSALWWLVSMVMTGVLYSVTLEGRGEELVLLRSMGAARGHVVAMFSLEVLVLSASGALVGVVAGWLAIGAVLEAMGGLPLPGAGTQALIALGSAALCVISSFVATAYPLLRHSGVTPSGTKGRPYTKC